MSFLTDAEDKSIANAYMVIVDINHQKNKELEFKEKAEKDHLTVLHNREKGTQLIKSYLAKKALMPWLLWLFRMLIILKL